VVLSHNATLHSDSTAGSFAFEFERRHLPPVDVDKAALARKVRHAVDGAALLVDAAGQPREVRRGNRPMRVALVTGSRSFGVYLRRRR
jgi:hypothetical protein